MEYNANHITKRERDCLIFLAENSVDGFPVRLYQIASTMLIAPPTASNLVKRLGRKGLTESRNGMIQLTSSGKEESQRILLVHRTYESLLCQSGVSENNACDEASKVDFIISEKDARLILRKIGNPKTCPHGKPINGEES